MFLHLQYRMQKKDHRPQVSVGSSTGKSYLQLRLSRRFILQGSAGLALLACFVLGSVWVTQKVWGIPEGAIATLFVGGLPELRELFVQQLHADAHELDSNRPQGRFFFVRFLPLPSFN